MTYSAIEKQARERTEASTRVRWSRYSYLATSILLTIGVLIQIYIAGMAVFIDPARWSAHVTFGTNLPVFLVLLFVFAFLGQLPRTHKGLPVLIFVLFFIQFSTAHRFGSLVGAIHPVNAVIIFWLSMVTVKHAWRSVVPQ